MPNELGLVVRKMDNAIHRMSLYPLGRAIGFPNIYPLNSNLSDRERYSVFEPAEPGVHLHKNCNYTLMVIGCQKVFEYQADIVVIVVIYSRRH